MRFTVNTLKQRQSKSLAIFNWRGQKIYYRPGTSDGAMIYDTLIKSEYYLPASLKPNVIVDVGSNIIHFHRLFPSARIYGFEPHPETFRILELNVSRIPLVSIFNFGLSDSDKKLEIPFKGTDFSVFSTGQPDRLDNDVPVVSCEVRNIATALPGLGIEKVDLIKIDCEGAEYDILTALPQSLLASCKWIVGEIHDEKGFELLAFLTSQFDLDLRKKMFAPQFLFHACNKKVISQMKGTFRRSKLQR
jgi:FkbM family methyltransferase